MRSCVEKLLDLCGDASTCRSPRLLLVLAGAVEASVYRVGVPQTAVSGGYFNRTIFSDGCPDSFSKLRSRPPSPKARLTFLTCSPHSAKTGRAQSAERGKFYRPIKQQLTVRVDADVLEWLKSQGSGYQSRLNDILRSAMLGAQR
jgi:uncharacterized protein (DUF4415 family)